MVFMVNDYRGRAPADPIDAMVHLPSCWDAQNFGHNPWWHHHTSREEVEREYAGLRVYYDPNCMEGQGPHLRRLGGCPCSWPAIAVLGRARLAA